MFIRGFLTIFAAVALLIAFQRPSVAEPLDQLYQDVETLKKENELLQDRLKNLEVQNEEDSFTEKKKVTISGYSDIEYDFTNQPGVNDHFSLNHLSLFFSEKLLKEWSLFSEVEFSGGTGIQSNTASDTVAASQGGISVEQMLIKYRPAPELEFALGRFLTPAGLWLIYHYPPFVPTQQQPLFLQNIFPGFSDGLKLDYTFNAFDSTVDAQVYVSNGSGNPGSIARNSGKSIGGRLDLTTDISDNRLEYGASFLSATDSTGMYQNSYLAHLKFNLRALGLQTEYAARQNMALGASSNFWDAGYYAQGTYDINKWTLAARWDWYNSDMQTALNDQYVYTGAVNYHFSHSLVGKVEFDQYNFSNPSMGNYYATIVSLAVALGDL